MMMKKVIVSILIGLSLAQTAIGQIPTDVLKPYKAYKVALEKDDKATALKNAKKAWNKAELLIGDSQTTGNLAQNYADLQRYQNFNEAIKAYERAVELAVEDTEDNKSIKLERLIKLSEMYISTPRHAEAKKYVREAENLIQETNLMKSTFAGEVKVLAGWLEGAGKDGNKALALSYFDDAIEIFESSSIVYDSVFPYAVHVYKGDVLQNLRKPIEAALEYQLIMQGLKVSLEEDHPFAQMAFNKWMAMRAVIDQHNKTEEALRAGICKCWPYDEMISNNKAMPLKRMPPKVHSSIRKSGHVIFKFDIDETGSPENLEVVSATDKVFIRASKIALKKWKYEPLNAANAIKTRKGHVQRFTFNIHDAWTGRHIPE